MSDRFHSPLTIISCRYFCIELSKRGSQPSSPTSKEWSEVSGKGSKKLKSRPTGDKPKAETQADDGKAGQFTVYADFVSFSDPQLMIWVQEGERQGVTGPTDFLVALCSLAPRISSTGTME